MAKAVATEEEKTEQEKGEELSKSFTQIMADLDAFCKAAPAKTEPLAKSTADQSEDEEDEEDAGTKKRSMSKAREAEDLAKALSTEETERHTDGGDLDGEQVFAELKQHLTATIAKAVTSIKRDILAHVDEQMAEMRTGQVLVAKALSVNGKILKEAMHEVVVIGEQPRARKSTLSVFDKSMSGNGGDTTDKKPALDPRAIMAKAVRLNAEKKLMPSDVSVINHYVMGGMGIPSQFAHLFETTQ